MITITLEIDNNTIALTLEQARQIHSELDYLLNQPVFYVPEKRKKDLIFDPFKPKEFQIGKKNANLSK